MLSAIAVYFNQSKILSCGKEVTLYHTIQTFNKLEKEAFWKHCGKRRKFYSGNQHFLLFSHHVFYSSQNKFKFFSHIYFIICKCFQFSPVQKFVTWWRVKVGLTLPQTTNFRLFQTQRVCRSLFHICWKWRRSHQTVRKHCGKRRNCLSRAISAFPTLFSKDLYCRHVKTRACLG